MGSAPSAPIGIATLAGEVIAAAVLGARIRRAVLAAYSVTLDRAHRVRQTAVAADVARALDLVDSPWFRRRVAAVLTSLGCKVVNVSGKRWRLGIRGRA